MSGVQEVNQTEIVNEFPCENDEEQILNEFIATLKAQVNKLQVNKLVLSDLNKKKLQLHEAERQELDKLLELQRNISETRANNGKIRDEIMYLDQSIHLKQKVMDEQDLELLQMTDKIGNASNYYLNSLDLKLKFKQKQVLNTKIINFEVLVNTAQVCLAYDFISERFDLISLYPVHPKFDEIRTFLNQSADVSGLLASVYLWMSTKIKKNEFNS